jgi:hypothetical protein
MPLRFTLVGPMRLALALTCVTSSPQAQSTGESCPVETRATTKLRLDDGRTVYVEPMAFARSGSTAVIAGEPMYVWTVGDGVAQLDTNHGLLGVTLTGGDVTPLPKPDLPGVVTHVRLLADGADFAAVFAVTDSSSVGRYDAKVLSYWFGRTDGRTWRELEKLPMPSGPLDGRRSSELVRSEEELLFAIPFGREGYRHVAIYRRADDWRMDTLAVPDAAYLALGVVGDKPMLYVVYPDTSTTDTNSLWVFARTETTWQLEGLVIRGGRQPVHDPNVVSHRSTHVLSWIGQTTATGEESAMTAPVDRDGRPGASHVLASGARSWDFLRDTARAAHWVVAVQAADGRKHMMLAEWTAAQPLVRDVVANPFTGHVLAASLEEDVIAVGPVFDPTGKEEPLVSGILRFAKRCAVLIRETP